VTGARGAGLAGVLLVSTVGPACATTAPDPHAAAVAYATAAQRGDAAALYALMTAASRRDRSQAEIAALVADERAEIAEQGAAIAGPNTRLEATARLRFADGEEAALDMRGGRYGVTAAGALPGGGRTPEEALQQLRRVLARRSYAGLMRVLSPATRASMEERMRSLVDGLDDPGALPVQVTGEAAVVAVPGGHQVKLKRDGGVWRVDDLD
jgi:hypothetical protein